MTNTWQLTLNELQAKADRAAYDARMATIAFLKHYHYENLTTEQMLRILEIIKEEK